ncbi:spore germination protein [Seinonella peptonophila]|uniref:Spore germination protein n=1 Tax=Seinonella peptonophila TaxID=112248 RepID=A0A1M4UW41_9BACL|nr:endospore germination permease [Seinonella peptonophila]SHE60833.1 spore germination protein [Seinonella peptonophila]
MKPVDDKITSYQTYALFLMTIIGTGVLSMPRRMATHVGTDGIWVIFLSGVVTWIIVYVMTRLCQRFPDQTLVEFTEEICSTRRIRWVGKVGKYVVLLFFAIGWLFVLAMVVRTFGEVIVSTILQRTPIEVIIMSFLLFAVSIAGSKIELIAKFNELLLPLLLIPIFFFIIALFQKGKVINLLPLFQVHWSAVIAAVFDTVTDFVGFHTILVFMAFYQNVDKAVKRHTISLIIVVLNYWLAIVTSYSLFGVDELKHILWPTSETVRPVFVPIQILERLEAGMIVVWMVASFTTMTNILAAFVESAMRTFTIRESNRKWTAIILILPIFFFSMLPENIHQLNRMSTWLGRYTFFVDLLIPFILLMFAIMRRKKGEKQHEQANSM